MKISFMSQDKAETIIPDPNTALISIIGTDGWRKLKPGWEQILKLTFDDIEEKTEDYILFNKQHALAILDFIQKLPPEIDHIIIHCWAGVSRSGAVAKFLCEYYQTSDFPKDYDRFNIRVYEILKKTSKTHKAVEKCTKK